MPISKQPQVSWNLTPLLSKDNDLKIEEKRKKLERESYKFINKWKDRDDYLKNPQLLRSALDEYEEWRKFYAGGGDEGYYFWLKTQQNQIDPTLKAKFNKIHDLTVKIENDIQFFTLKIAKISPKDQRRLLNEKCLKEYKHFLEKLFIEAQFLLSEPEEKILNLKMQTSHTNWAKMTSTFLSKETKEILSEKGKKEVKSFAEIISLSSHKDKKVRDLAAQALNEILEKHSDAAEHEINSILANKKIDDELRKVSRPDLTRHFNDDIESDVVDALIASVSKRFEISINFYKLKARLFGLKKLQYHERNLEYGKIEKKYSYLDSINLISKVFTNLDQKFTAILNLYVEKNQIDAYPQKGKRDGAFCAHSLPSQPTYILLNHTNKLSDLLTMAHELGHGINNEFVKEKQNAVNFGTPTSTAEVASTFMEDFVLQEILKEADEELQLSLMMMKLNDDISTIFRQIAFYKFEQELHTSFREKGYLSKKDIGQLFQKQMQDYMGPYVEQSPGSKNWWIYVSHFRAFFYVYSYAGGLIISKYLQNEVKKNPQFIKKVKEFLSAGLSDSPKNIFLNMGVDITNPKFWDQGLADVENLLKETTKLAQKLKKI